MQGRIYLQTCQRLGHRRLRWACLLSLLPVAKYREASCAFHFFLLWMWIGLKRFSCRGERETHDVLAFPCVDAASITIRRQNGELSGAAAALGSLRATILRCWRPKQAKVASKFKKKKIIYFRARDLLSFVFVFSFPGRAPAIMKVSEYLSKIRVRFKTTARPLLLMAALLLTLPHRPSLAQGTTTDWQNLPLHFPEPRERVGFVDSIPHFRLRHPSSTSKQMNAFVFSDGLKLFFFF